MSSNQKAQVGGDTGGVDKDLKMFYGFFKIYPSTMDTHAASLSTCASEAQTLAHKETEKREEFRAFEKANNADISEKQAQIAKLRGEIDELVELSQKKQELHDVCMKSMVESASANKSRMEDIRNRMKLSAESKERKKKRFFDSAWDSSKMQIVETITSLIRKADAWDAATASSATSSVQSSRLSVASTTSQESVLQPAASVLSSPRVMAPAPQPAQSVPSSPRVMAPAPQPVIASQRVATSAPSSPMMRPASPPTASSPVLAAGAPSTQAGAGRDNRRRDSIMDLASCLQVQPSARHEEAKQKAEALKSKYHNKKKVSFTAEQFQHKNVSDVVQKLISELDKKIHAKDFKDEKKAIESIKASIAQLKTFNESEYAAVREDVEYYVGVAEDATLKFLEHVKEAPQTKPRSRSTPAKARPTGDTDAGAAAATPKAAKPKASKPKAAIPEAGAAAAVASAAAAAPVAPKPPRAPKPIQAPTAAPATPEHWDAAVEAIRAGIRKTDRPETYCKKDIKSCLKLCPSIGENYLAYYDAHKTALVEKTSELIAEETAARAGAAAAQAAPPSVDASRLALTDPA